MYSTTSSYSDNISLCESAIKLHDLFGCPIVPCKDKVPTGQWKHWQRQEQTVEEIKRLPWHKANGLGLLTGGGIVCRDFDVEKSYHQWAKANPKLASRLPTVKTS